MKSVTDFQVIDHGPEHSDYFQGCGVAFTEFTDVATGIGDTDHDAYEDALEQLASNDWEVESIGPAVDHFDRKPHRVKSGDHEDGPYWYVSVRVK